MVCFSYSLPLIPAALEQICHAIMFTKRDLGSAYNLVRILPGVDITPSGYYEYRVMPFGLVNTPAVFQSFMNEVFWDLLGKFTMVYLDNILMYSRTPTDHIQHVTTVLKRLQRNDLFLKLEK
ncbi:MAG: reverse transcriptase family protein [Aeromonas sp.]